MSERRQSKTPLRVEDGTFQAAVEGRPRPTQESDKALEEKAREILRKLFPCDFTSVSDYDRDRIWLLDRLREVAEQAKREEAAEWEPGARAAAKQTCSDFRYWGTCVTRNGTGLWCYSCLAREILRRRGGKP